MRSFWVVEDGEIEVVTHDNQFLVGSEKDIDGNFRKRGITLRTRPGDQGTIRVFDDDQLVRPISFIRVTPCLKAGFGRGAEVDCQGCSGHIDADPILLHQLRKVINCWGTRHQWGSAKKEHQNE